MKRSAWALVVLAAFTASGQRVASAIRLAPKRCSTAICASRSVSHGSPVRDSPSARISRIFFLPSAEATGTPESDIRSTLFFASRSKRRHSAGSSCSTAARV